jgi:hypothetical protein
MENSRSFLFLSGETVGLRPAERLFMNWTIGVGAACLLLSSLTVSGCGSFATSVINSMVHGHEFSRDSGLCENRCSLFKGDEYTFCYRQCMTEQTERRRREKEKSEAEGSGQGKTELDKNLRYQSK